MKRGILFILLLLVLLPSIYASIEINEITPKIYNLGDKLTFVGFITRENSFNGFFKTSLICQDKNIPLLTRALTLYAGQKYSFNEEFVIPNILTGNCTLKASIEESNNNVLEDRLSNEFTITKELKGNFVLTNNKIQLGKDIDVRGEVFKINGRKINGVVNIYFKKENNVLFIDTSQITEGVFAFNIPSNYTTIGSYSIDFNVRDVEGNEKLFSDSIKFDVTNLLSLDLRVINSKLNPGESFEIVGLVKDVYGNSVNTAEFTIKLGDKELKGKVLSGEISHKIVTDPDVKSGFHKILIDVADGSGNKGTSVLSIDIIPKDSRVEFSLEKDSYKPGDKVKITAFVYDQGNDLVDRDIKIEIRNLDNDKIFENVGKRDFEFNIPLVANPGEWVVKASSLDLNSEKKFYLSEVKSLNYDISGQTLVVTNNGNVNFDDTLSIKMNGVSENLIINKKVSLQPGESFSFDLGSEVKTGLYKVSINGKNFDNIKIEGKQIVYYKEYSNLIFILIVLLILGFLLFLKVKKVKLFKKKERKVVDYVQEVKKVLGNKIEQKETQIKNEFRNTFRPQNRNNFDIKRKDLEINKREKLDDFRKSSSYLRRRRDEREFKDGMFNMFK